MHSSTRTALSGAVSAALIASACSTGNPGSPARISVAPAAAPDQMVVPSGPRDLTADQQVSHVLNRLTFGAKPGDVARVRQMGVDRWMDMQLHPERIDDAAMESFLSGYRTLNMDPAELQRLYPPPNVLRQQLSTRNGSADKLSPSDSNALLQAGNGVREVQTELFSARVARASVSERQLQEVLTDFWLNHFTVYIQKGPQERYHLAEYENKTIRPHVFGKFRDLLGAVAKSPAMLMYLDNWQSQADSTQPRLANVGGQLTVLTPQQMGRLQQGRGGRGGIGMMGAPQPQAPGRRRGGLNENYGRELLELHTLGVDGGYTQQDVINVARALTGWTIYGPQQQAAGSGFQFVPVMHDAGPKTVLGHKLAGGRGIDDGEDVLDIVAHHPATAHYIAFKLARRFVADTPNAALVDRAAAVFTRTDGDLRAVVRTIITSPEFFAQTSYRSKVKTPFEVVVSTLRALNAVPDATIRTAQIIGGLGQPIFGHQSPNGWPETGDQWMNTGAILNRINFGSMVAANRLPGASPFNFAGADALRAAPVEKQVDGVIAALLSGEASPETRAILLSGENPFAKTAGAADAPRADAMSGRGGGDPDPMMGAGQPPPRVGVVPGLGGGPGGRGGGPPQMGQLPQAKGLALLVGLAIGSPEFQRR